MQQSSNFDNHVKKLAVFVSDKVPEIVMGDPGRFRQIITNLVGNSVKVHRTRTYIYPPPHFLDVVQVR
ncbi:hypothetical protein I3843_Q055900 [Carya illinoinensis]|nr:hypothetical protein I3843_Q055900 [Carya illinoinensis]